MTSLQKNNYELAVYDINKNSQENGDDSDSLGSISSADEKEMEVMLLGEHLHRFEA